MCYYFHIFAGNNTLKCKFMTQTNYDTKIINWLDDNEIQYFSFDFVFKKLHKKIPNLDLIIERLVKKEVLYRLEKGKYVRRNFSNEHVIGSFLVRDGVIAYWTALNLHGLTTQFSNSIYVQTSRQKSIKRVLGVMYRFVKVKEAKIGSIVKFGHGNNEFAITNIEKTLFDCIDLPQYSGGIEQLFTAIAKAKLNSSNLIAAAEQVGNISATKRIAYLIELYKKKNCKHFLEYANSKVNSKYSLLDINSSNDGPYNAKWKLRLNVNEESLLSLQNIVKA